MEDNRTRDLIGEHGSAWKPRCPADAQNILAESGCIVLFRLPLSDIFSPVFRRAGRD